MVKLRQQDLIFLHEILLPLDPFFCRVRTFVREFFACKQRLKLLALIAELNLAALKLFLHLLKLREQLCVLTLYSLLLFQAAFHLLDMLALLLAFKVSVLQFLLEQM